MVHVVAIRRARPEITPNWGMMGCMMFCLGFWYEVVTLTMKFWGL